MKTKYIAAVILLLVGTNIFTYATARYRTTTDVLTRAQEHTFAALRKEGLDYLVYPPERYPAPKSNSAIYMAIRQAGGMYYGWNDDLLYWGLGGIVAISGLLLTRLESKKSIVA